MFLHQDGLYTITWQAQISGRKEWVLCDPAPEFSQHVPAAGADAFHPDLDKHPSFVNASCTSVIVKEGEILIYPPHWWHQTLNLEFPAIGLAGRLVNKYVLAAVCSAFVFALETDSILAETFL